MPAWIFLTSLLTSAVMALGWLLLHIAQERYTPAGGVLKVCLGLPWVSAVLGCALSGALGLATWPEVLVQLVLAAVLLNFVYKAAHTVLRALGEHPVHEAGGTPAWHG